MAAEKVNKEVRVWILQGIPTEYAVSLNVGEKERSCMNQRFSAGATGKFKFSLWEMWSLRCPNRHLIGDIK